MPNPVPVSRPAYQYVSNMQSLSSLHQSSSSSNTPKIASVFGQHQYMNDKKMGLQQILNGGKDCLSNEQVLGKMKRLQGQTLMGVQKVCLQRMGDYALFLLYQISNEFNFKVLHEVCVNELVQQNYEQLNYSKYDLVKCSKKTFESILEEYLQNLGKGRITGIKVSELINVINDYSVMAGIEQKQTNRLQAKYVKNGQISIIGAEGEVRRKGDVKKKDVEIVENGKNKIMLVLPPKLQDSCDQDLSSSRELKEKTGVGAVMMGHKSERKLEQSLGQNMMGRSLRLKQSADLISQQICRYKQKESVLYEQIRSTRKQIQNDENAKCIQQGFVKLEKSVNEMQNSIRIQNQRIEKLKRNAAIQRNNGVNKDISQGKSVRDVYGI